MAFRNVTLGIAVLLFWTGAAAAAPTRGVAYRNGTLVATDVEQRRLAVDLGDGVTHLRAGQGVDLATLRPGDTVVVGIGDVNGQPHAVYVRTSADSAPRLSVPFSMGVSMGPRRPLHVIPNPGTRPPAMDVDETPIVVNKAPALLVVTEPEPEPASVPATAPAAAPAEPPMPSSLELARESGRRQAAAALESMGVLAHEVDRHWLMYVQAGCPAGDTRARGWLSLASDATAPPGACADLLASVKKSGAAVQQRLSAIEDEARAASVMPGTLRALLERYDLKR
jgi:hypothetical protein